MTRKLLLADDSVTIQRVIELTFSGEDVQVVAVGDGEQAIARIPIEKPDIVLADIAMPKRSGYEVAAFVKEHPELSHVPVLLLAGAFEPVDEARAKQVKCDGVLVKPFEPQQVIARVRELVDGVASRESKFDERGAPTQSLGAADTGLTSAASATPEPDWAEAALEPITAASAAVAEPPAAPVEEPRLPAPEIGVASPEPAAGSLEDYFDRLDAAFATLGSSPPDVGDSSTPRPTIEDEDDIFAGVPTVDEVLAGASLMSHPEIPAAAPPRIAAPPPEPPDTSATIAAAPHARTDRQAGAEQGEAAHGIAKLFHLLWAIEQGEADVSALASPPAAAPPQVTDDLIDEITRRVLERLGPDTVRAVVADIVSDVAERLVREEIDRIRSAKNV